MLLAWLGALAADPSALAAVETCRAAAAASGKPCDTPWRGVRLRMDAVLHGSVKAGESGRGATWVTDRPYDVVHRTGACALVSRGVIVIQPYDRDLPAFVWGDRNAERRERQVTLDDGRRAGWTDRMTADDDCILLGLLTHTRHATFAWRPARAKTLSSTTLDLTGFGDLTTLLTAMTQLSAKAHAAG